MEQLSAVVTAGGTSEPIDDVRIITNISTGRFGHAIASELVAHGAQATELCPESTVARLGETEGVAFEHFDTSSSLRGQLLERSGRPDIIFHAAAVSDYVPAKHAGKLNSDADELTITLSRNPKIISELRPTYGHESFLVGFKLLSNVNEADLVAAAMHQLHKNRLNLVVANDLQNLKDGQHPIIAVTPEGGTIPFDGERQQVAADLVAFVLKRAGVSWYVSIAENDLTVDERAAHGFQQALDLAHSLQILTDSNGNVSARGEQGLMVSPRQVDKSVLTTQDGIAVLVDQEDRTIRYTGERKPSIDTGMSDYIYQTFPQVDSIIHFHAGWGRMASKTTFPYPCGAKEEAEAVINASGADTTGTIAVELIHHGFFMGLRSQDVPRLHKEWQDIRAQFLQHLDDVGTRQLVNEKLLRPIFDATSIAGIIYHNKEGAAVYLGEHGRGDGLGKHVVQQLKQRGYSINTVDDCNVRDYYKKQGFNEEFSPTTGIYTLTPPPAKLNREF